MNCRVPFALMIMAFSSVSFSQGNSPFTATLPNLVGLLDENQKNLSEDEQRYQAVANKASNRGGKTSSSENEEINEEIESLIEDIQILREHPEEMQAYIARRLEEIEDPNFVLQELISSKKLALSPREITFIKAAMDMIQKAYNEPLIVPDVRSGLVTFNPNDRYKTYEFDVHSTGISMLEFYDANGNEWPIVDFTPIDGFDLQYGYKPNTLAIQSINPYKVGYSYILLDGYKNQISIKINYSNKIRDGIRTFSLPFLYKVDKESGTPKATYSPLSSIKASQSSVGSSKIPDLTQEDLMYLATLGHPDVDSESTKYLKRVFVDKPELAQIWMYGGKYLVRSRFQLMSHQYEAYIPSTDEAAIFVTNELDTIIDFNVRGQTESVYLPEYHLSRN